MRGARAAEQRLLGEVAGALELASRDWSLLARPLRIVVPSRGLRQHVCAALVARLGHGLAGVEVQTHRALAFEVLERGGEPHPHGEALFPVLVRRAAREEPLLRERLDPLQEGYGVVAATVGDLLDAGLEPAHADALEELLRERGAGTLVAERALAVLRVAQRVLAALVQHGLDHRSGLLRRARERLEREGAAALPTRRLWVHGFADATGVAADLLEALLRTFPGSAIVDQPPDPASPARSESEFTERLVERLGRARPLERPASEEAGGEGLALVRAAGSPAELRAGALRVRALLDAGLRPEAIAIVARRLEPYRAALRVQLERLGIPCSAPGLRVPAGRLARHARALLDLVGEGERTPTDQVLDASVWPEAESSDLRIGLHAAGLGRLGDLAEVDARTLFAERSSLPLPVRRGSGEELAGNGASPGARRRTLARTRFESAQRRARALCARLRAWPGRAPAAVHWGELAGLLGDLGGTRAEDPFAEAFERIDELAAEIPAGLELDQDEWVVLLRRSLGDLGEQPIGGAGAGVQVLSATEARGRTFAHVFLLGLERGIFPRPVREDPLLPDDLREQLATLLPDVPIKQRGVAEERHLFAELLSSSTGRTLSWQAVSDDGRERAASPFVERLRLADPALAPEAAPGLWALPEAGSAAAAAARPAHEHAVLAGMHAGRARFAALLGVALEEGTAYGGGEPESHDYAGLAASRRAVLDELDPPGPPGRDPVADALGPYFGFVGGKQPRPEPGAAVELYVTTLERLAVCPWQTFLLRELRVEPLPDALDALDVTSPLLLGALVHRVLERIVREALAPGEATPELADLVARKPVAVPWPEEARLQGWLAEEARALARDAGIALRGLVLLLARQARGPLEVARRLAWDAQGGALQALGAEVTGAWVLCDEADRPRRLGFRTDLVDRADGPLRLTDYKTGTPISDAVKEATRATHFRAKVAAGEHLQALAYWCAARALAPGQEVEGRFLFLREGLHDERREFRVRAEDPEFERQFLEVCRTLLASADAGACFPRLADADEGSEPRACSYCEVHEACLRGESSHRQRLVRWAQRSAGVSPALLSSAERALLATWRLGQRDGSASEDAS